MSRTRTCATEKPGASWPGSIAASPATEAARAPSGMLRR
jgi:hypothetical protein